MAQFKTQKFTFFAPRTVFFVKETAGSEESVEKRRNLPSHRKARSNGPLSSLPAVFCFFRKKGYFCMENPTL